MSDPSPQDTATAATSDESSGKVHDLGYRPYRGERRRQAERYKVIARKLVRRAWQGWWRWRAWLVITVMIVVVFAVLFYVATFLASTPFGADVSNQLEKFVPTSFGVFSAVAFAIGLSSLAGVVARDLRAGAFEFYFSKSIRPRDYLLGKLAGGAILIGIPLLGGPVLIALVWVGLSAAGGQASTAIGQLPAAILCGGAATAAYVITPLAISCVARKPALTIALWAGLYTVIGSLFFNGMADLLDQPPLAALHLHSAMRGMIAGLFPAADARGVPPLWASLAGLAVYCAGGVSLLLWRLGRAEKSGLGGG